MKKNKNVVKIAFSTEPYVPSPEELEIEKPIYYRFFLWKLGEWMHCKKDCPQDLHDFIVNRAQKALDTYVAACRACKHNTYAMEQAWQVLGEGMDIEEIKIAAANVEAEKLREQYIAELGPDKGNEIVN